MNRKIRILIITATAALGGVLLILAAAFFAMQTNWFKNKVRERVVAAIEQTTGGAVELGSFNYDWRSLTAEFRNLVVHGAERPGTEPLFQADSIRVGLKIVSAFERNIDVASLLVDRARVHLAIGPDKRTNIPSPKLGRMTANETIARLLKLKIRHFEIRNSIFETDAEKIPLNARGEDVFVLLMYDRRGPRYNIQASSQKLHFNSERWGSLDAAVNLTAQLEKDRVEIRKAVFSSNDSNLQATGTLQHFANPIADFQIAAHLNAPRVDHLLAGGRINGGGALHYDSSSSVSFSGKLSGRVNDVGFDSDIVANPGQAILRRLNLTGFGARLNGEAVIPAYRKLRVDGMLSGLSVRQAAALLHRLSLPYAAIASGRIHFEANLDSRRPDFIADAKLNLTPHGSGIPVSGNLDVAYRRDGNLVIFGNSHLDFPNTQLSFSGPLNANLQVVLDSKNLDDLKAALFLAVPHLDDAIIPVLEQNGTAHFDGTVAGLLSNPELAGNIALTHFRVRGEPWDQVRSRIFASVHRLEFSSAVLDRAALHATGSGHIDLENWNIQPASAIRMNGQFRGADLSQFRKLPILRGIASGSIDLNGSLANPQGHVQLSVANLDAYGELLNQVQLRAAIQGNEVRIDHGRVQAGPALLSFSGTYTHAADDWRRGDVQIKADSNGFPLASLGPVRKYEPGLNAQVEIHAEAAAHLAPDRIEPSVANGTAVFRQVSINNVPYGSVTFNATTHGQLLDTNFTGDLRGSHLAGSARVQLVANNSVQGELHLDRIQLSTLYALINSAHQEQLPVEGFLSGGLSFEGPLQQPDKVRGTAEIQQLELTSKANTATPELIFRNLNPIVLEASNGIATIRNFHIGGKDTSLIVTGSIPYLTQHPMNLNVNGLLDLRFFQLLDPNVQSSGVSLIQAAVRGPLSDPRVNGTVELKNGAFFFRDIPNGLTAVNGTLRFDRNRATIDNLTAETGGGQLSLSGFLGYSPSAPLVYRLEANAENVRMRYAGGISVTANSQLRLTGTSVSSVLSGTGTISRVVLSPNADVGNLLAAFAVPSEAPANEKDFLTGMQFDVHLESASNLQFSTALSRDIEADIDLRLRGTPAHPIVLGNISANQGEIRVFGAKYSVNRGDISFSNPVKIDPVLNLDLQTLVRGITVDITISGSLNKLNINYRSDPPLQPRDIIALLTVGRTPSIGSTAPTAQVANDVTALQSSANTVLGQAVSPSSNRLSKLFGVTNIRIDPMALQGITTTPQARLTVEQNISRQITVTYVTNLSQTAEQIFRLEWAFSPDYSIVALRDDNGEFGIDIQYRKRFK